ncbi:MAG: hypothetical protein WCT30_03715 [Desulfurivibrionaceae bacterium]|jgi:hypothetical protein
MALNSNARKWDYDIRLGRQPEWWRYFGEYTCLVDLVFERAKESEVAIIARPQLFLIRHTLELGYKMNILELEKFSGLPSTLKLKGPEAHELERLHQDFNRHFREIAKKYALPSEIINQYDQLTNSLANLKDLLHKFDQGSYAFRYPVGTDGKTPSLSISDTLNMTAVKEMYERAKTLLKYTTDVISEHLPA